MEHNTLSKKIVETIKQEKLQPKSAWFFAFKQIFLWVSIVFASLISSLAITFLIFQGRNMHLFPPGTAPIFMGISATIIAIALIAVVYSLYHTRHGYRHAVWLYVLVSVIAGIALGTILFAVHAHESVEQVLDPHHTGFFGGEAKIEALWSDPHSGMVAGQIMAYDGSLMVLGLFNGTSVQGDLTSLNQVPPLEVGNQVKMVGWYDGEVFHSCTIAPWDLVRGIRDGSPQGQGSTDRISPQQQDFVPGQPGFLAKEPFGHEVREVFEVSPRSFRDYLEIKDEIVRSNQCEQPE